MLLKVDDEDEGNFARPSNFRLHVRILCIREPLRNLSTLLLMQKWPLTYMNHSTISHYYLKVQRLLFSAKNVIKSVKKVCTNQNKENHE